MRRPLAPGAALALALLLAACGGERTVPPPVTSGVAGGQPAGSVYVAQPGDTVYSVARQLHSSVRALIEANQLRPPYQLSAGQRLLIPGTSVYLVGKGDNLSVIARKTGVPFATLARLNGLAPPYLLQIGQKLQLPVAGPVLAAAPAPAPPPPVEIRPPPPPSLAPPVTPATAPPTAPAAPATTFAAAPPPAASPSLSAGVAPSSARPQEMAVLPLPPPPARSTRGFIWPVKGEVVTEFGTTGKGQHNDGINIAAPRGTPVLAADGGVVAYAGNELRGFGNLLLIKHEDGWMTAYAHADSLLVRRGDIVRRGQKIALVGDSGGVPTPQLHFELRQGTRAVDPLPVLLGKTSLPSSPADPPDPG